MKSIGWGRAIALVGLAIALVGCSSAKSTPAPATAAVETVEADKDLQEDEALVNTSWTPVEFGSEGDSVPVIPGTYPSLHFMVERYNGYTSCDYFLGVYHPDGNSLALDTPAMTEYGCDEPAMIDQGASYTNLLWDVSTYKIVDGKMYLYDVYDQLLLTMVPLEPLPFEETIWELKFLSPDLGTWEVIMPETSITIRFDGDQLSGNAGCNDYSAPYTLNDTEFTLGAITVADNTCDEPDGVMSQESAYLQMLETAGRLVVTARSFQMLTDDRTPLFMFHGE